MSKEEHEKLNAYKDKYENKIIKDKDDPHEQFKIKLVGYISHPDIENVILYLCFVIPYPEVNKNQITTLGIEYVEKYFDIVL